MIVCGRTDQYEAVNGKNSGIKIPETIFPEFIIPETIFPETILSSFLENTPLFWNIPESVEGLKMLYLNRFSRFFFWTDPCNVLYGGQTR